MEGLKKCILIVEDNKLAWKMAIITIESLGCEIHTANNGAEAITQFKMRNYDLIFMDLGLPDIDGYTVTEIIRELEKKRQTHTPIVALTAHTKDEFRQNALKAGMDDLISKPLTTDKAQKMLDEHTQPSVTSNIKLAAGKINHTVK